MVAGLIQVRKDSSRFPEKAFASFGDGNLISHVISLVKKTKYFTPILLTSAREIDDDLEKIALDKNILCFRGDLENVAKRAVDCINDYNISYFARINGDCPFISPKLIDEAFELLVKNNMDFVSNIIKRSFPYGVSVEVFKAGILLENYSEIEKNDEYKEHLTLYFYKNLHAFKYHSIFLEEDYQDIKLTIDYPEDIGKLRKVYQKFPEISEIIFNEIRKYINNINEVK